MGKKIMIMASLLLAALALAAQSITVISPNGGEQWALNSAHGIIWSCQNAGSAKVDIILRRAGGKVGTIQSNVPLAAGSWQWSTVGKLEDGTLVTPGSDYIVRIRDAANTFGDSSNAVFAIVSPSPAIREVPDYRPPRPLPLSGPKLAVTAIHLERNASGYSIIFGYKNVGSAALPKRHELTVKPDYRVLIDGREIDQGDLFVPESPPAGPGWEMTTHSGGFINFPADNDPSPWYIGREITVILNERNALNMGSAAKTSSLLPIVLTVGYDLAFGPVSFDWSICKAHVVVTKVGSSPQLSKNFYLRYTVRGYHPPENVKHGTTEATVTLSPGPFTSYGTLTFPSSGPFPKHLDVPAGGGYSTFYELELVLSKDFRDEFDERNNSAPVVRYNRPEVPVGPRIMSIGFGKAQNSQGKDVLRTWITLNNKDNRGYSGLRLILKRNDDKLQEWPGLIIGPEQQRMLTNDSKWDPMSGNVFTAYLYDGSGKILYDARSQYR